MEQIFRKACYFMDKAPLIDVYLPIPGVANIVTTYWVCWTSFEDVLYGHHPLQRSNIASLIEKCPIQEVVRWRNAVQAVLDRYASVKRLKLSDIFYLPRMVNCQRIWCWFVRGSVCTCSKPIIITEGEL